MSTRPGTSFNNDMESEIHALLMMNDTQKLRAYLAKQHPAEIADVMDRLNDMQRDTLFALLSTETKAEVLDEMSITATRHVLDRLPP